MRLAARMIVVVALAGAIVVGWGCARRLQQVAGVANQPPVVSLRSSAVGGASDATAEHVLTWSGADPDGRVDHYLVTTDIRALSHETEGWTATDERSRTLHARRAVRGAARPVGSAEPEFDFFAVRAVDERGAVSKPAYRAFFAENAAPTVTIVSPTPFSLLDRVFPPTFWVRWEGSDPDGPNGRPAKYKFKLFKWAPGSDYYAYIVDPDSLRRQYAPTFTDWDSISGDSTGIQLRNLEPMGRYLFVITALDAEGAYDPVFSLYKNVLDARVAFSTNTLGPVIRMFNEYFDFHYASGGFPRPIPPAWVVRVEAPATEPFTLRWSAAVGPWARLAGYRWALDIADPDDETPRKNKNDLAHWSDWSLAATSATVGPFHAAALDLPHRLFVEAQDENGLTSIGVVEFRLVRPTFDQDLLIVDDTRLRPDMRSYVANPASPDSIGAPRGDWPTAAELDTFLYAVGGVRWRMTPTGTLSPQGIFKGYRFDTLGTRRGLEDPTLPLDVLGRYRHVIWMLDPNGALNYPEYKGGSPTNPVYPMTALFYMSMPNKVNTLAEWVKSGGSLWALGGGIGSATNIPWNNSANDTAGRVYTSAGLRPDLTPGRFMYDMAHWQSEFRPGPFQKHGQVTKAPFPVGGWHGAPAYSLLPTTLRLRSPATDPMWPNRGNGPEYYYPPPFWSLTIEYLSKPNAILDDRNPSPQRTDVVQALDTLMVATSAMLPPQGSNPAVDRIVNPVMTYYHGPDCGPVVFSGFDIWTWTRADCVRLVDAVLTGLWGLPRSADAVGPAAQSTQRKRD